MRLHQSKKQLENEKIRSGNLKPVRGWSKNQRSALTPITNTQASNSRPSGTLTKNNRQLQRASIFKSVKTATSANRILDLIINNKTHLEENLALSLQVLKQIAFIIAPTLSKNDSEFQTTHIPEKIVRNNTSNSKSTSNKKAPIGSRVRNTTQNNNVRRLSTEKMEVLMEILSSHLDYLISPKPTNSALDSDQNSRSQKGLDAIVTILNAFVTLRLRPDRLLCASIVDFLANPVVRAGITHHPVKIAQTIGGLRQLRITQEAVLSALLPPFTSYVERHCIYHAMQRSRSNSTATANANQTLAPLVKVGSTALDIVPESQFKLLPVNLSSDTSDSSSENDVDNCLWRSGIRSDIENLDENNESVLPRVVSNDLAKSEAPITLESILTSMSVVADKASSTMIFDTASTLGNAPHFDDSYRHHHSFEPALSRHEARFFAQDKHQLSSSPSVPLEESDYNLYNTAVQAAMRSLKSDDDDVSNLFSPVKGLHLDHVVMVMNAALRAKNAKENISHLHLLADAVCTLFPQYQNNDAEFEATDESYKAIATLANDIMQVSDDFASIVRLSCMFSICNNLFDSNEVATVMWRIASMDNSHYFQHLVPIMFADDHAKPFELKVFMHRARAVLRRAGFTDLNISQLFYPTTAIVSNETKIMMNSSQNVQYLILTAADYIRTNDSDYTFAANKNVDLWKLTRQWWLFSCQFNTEWASEFISSDDQAVTIITAALIAWLT